jgi:NADP-dependent 3-hydroxy acid dehydrogenase YdfG
MTDQSQPRLPFRHDDGVVLITHADSDAGHRRAGALLADGRRVAVTARHVTKLARILTGHSTERVVALAADVDDPTQLEKLLQRTTAKLGAVTWIMDGRTGALTPAEGTPELPLAS